MFPSKIVVIVVFLLWSNKSWLLRRLTFDVTGSKLCHGGDCDLVVGGYFRSSQTTAVVSCHLDKTISCSKPGRFYRCSVSSLCW